MSVVLLCTDRYLSQVQFSRAHSLTHLQKHAYARYVDALLTIDDVITASVSRTTESTAGERNFNGETTVCASASDFVSTTITPLTDSTGSNVSCAFASAWLDARLRTRTDCDAESRVTLDGVLNATYAQVLTTLGTTCCGSGNIDTYVSLNI